MAMSALGAETSIDKFKKAGFKPFLLAAILWCWLIGGGYCLAKYLVPMLGVKCWVLGVEFWVLMKCKCWLGYWVLNVR